MTGLIRDERVIVDANFNAIAPERLRIAEGVFLSIRLVGKPDETVGFRARKNTAPIDFRAIGTISIRHYWERIHSRPSSPVILEPDEFYVFASRERVRIPPEACAEMVPYDAGSGELRTHYAGFFDSGFGYDPGSPAAVVLEVRNRDVPFLIEDGHPLFRLVFFWNTEPPEILYGNGIASHYQSQGLRLARQFTSSADVDSGESVSAEVSQHLPFGQ